MQTYNRYGLEHFCYLSCYVEKKLAIRNSESWLRLVMPIKFIKCGHSNIQIVVLVIYEAFIEEMGKYLLAIRTYEAWLKPW